MGDFLSPDEVIARGLRYLCIDSQSLWTSKKRYRYFKKLYGSSPLVISVQWYDLCHLEDNAGVRVLEPKEVSRGFKMFMMVHFFLWHYPRNAETFGAAFRVCDKYAGGAKLWRWIGHIAALQLKVIFWPAELDMADSEVNVVSIDGVDKKCWERKHDTLPYDKRNFSQKHNHGALKYQVTLCAHRQRCAHIFGPVRGGMSDREMLERSGIYHRLKEGKLANVDRGYIDKKHKEKLSWPNAQDLPATNNLKSRIRLRHETFNGRMGFFESMRQTWRHTERQHGIAFRAVAVIVQYQMDNGSPLFDA